MIKRKFAENILQPGADLVEIVTAELLAEFGAVQRLFGRVRNLDREPMPLQSGDEVVHSLEGLSGAIRRDGKIIGSYTLELT